MYRSHPDGFPLEVEVPEDQERPPEVTVGGLRYLPEYECVDVQALREQMGLVVNAPSRPSLRDGRFESRSLPRWDPHHRGEFSPDGKPRFTSRVQAQEYARRAGGETDVDVKYGAL
jgi:hypothetical protein